MTLRPHAVAAAVALCASFAANAVPITQYVGTADLLGTTYDVTMLYSSTGTGSFSSLLPTITFTNSADALTAAKELGAQFGASFDWAPTNSSAMGGMIVYAQTATQYSYVTVNEGSGFGPFQNYAKTTTDVFGFIELSPVAAVPEPASWALMMLGLGGVGYIGRKRAGKSA